MNTKHLAMLASKFLSWRSSPAGVSLINAVLPDGIPLSREHRPGTLTRVEAVDCMTALAQAVTKLIHTAETFPDSGSPSVHHSRHRVSNQRRQLR